MFARGIKTCKISQKSIFIYLYIVYDYFDIKPNNVSAQGTLSLSLNNVNKVAQVFYFS